MAGKESLAAKLDEDLDNYVDNMIEKNKNYRYSQPLSEENWEEVRILVVLYIHNNITCCSN